MTDDDGQDLVPDLASQGILSEVHELRHLIMNTTRH